MFFGNKYRFKRRLVLTISFSRERNKLEKKTKKKKRPFTVFVVSQHIQHIQHIQQYPPVHTTNPNRDKYSWTEGAPVDGSTSTTLVELLNIFLCFNCLFITNCLPVEKLLVWIPLDFYEFVSCWFVWDIGVDNFEYFQISSGLCWQTFPTVHNHIAWIPDLVIQPHQSCC